MNSFSLIAIRILPGCEPCIRKVLKENKFYFFNNKYKEQNGELIINDAYNVPVDFFSERVNINAIVGKNGSGKSSIIEVLLRLINNLAQQLFQKELNKSTYDYTELVAINELNAELYFETSEVVRDKVEKNINILKCNNNRVYFKSGKGFIHAGSFIDLEAQKNDNCLGELELKESLDILRQFFFTIVSNYSFHAYNSMDYLGESEGRDKNGNQQIWIDRVFHKNDGYLTPIVLNPYRLYGTIDVEKEKILTNFRLAFLFYYFKQKKEEFMEKYKFSHLKFFLNKDHVTEKYTFKDNKSRSLQKEIVKVKFEKLKEDIFNVTLRCYIQDPQDYERLYTAYEYLVYKTYSISEKYPNYSNCIKRNIRQFNDVLNDKKEYDEIKFLVKKIVNDNSHTTLKIKQTLNYIKYIQSITQDTNDYILLEEQYMKEVVLNSSEYLSLTAIDQILISFPPPFYRIDIHLTAPNGEIITFNQMSSGERQFLYYMSTLLYHLKNLDTVVNGEKSVHYRFVNIIFEEVELYFHPEYQRQFIQKLIKYLELAKFEKIDYFNIIIATHSPFILSDIPQDNILFLDKGIQVNDKVDMATFGANIHELFTHGFFMDSTTGEYASRKINEIIEFHHEVKMANSNQVENLSIRYKQKKDEYNFITNSVGEDVIRGILKNHIEFIEENLTDKNNRNNKILPGYEKD